MRKFQMFRAMIAAAMLCIAGTGAAQADCIVKNVVPPDYSPRTYDATNPSVTQYEYKLSYTTAGCANYSVEIYLWSPAATNKGLAVANPDKATIGGYFSTKNPVNSVPVTNTLNFATDNRSLFSQNANSDGSQQSISMYYNVRADDHFGLYKPGTYSAVVNAVIYVRDNLTGTAVSTGLSGTLKLAIVINPTAWLDHANDKLDFGELTYGGVTKEPVYIHAYTNVPYALTLHSDNGWVLKNSSSNSVSYSAAFDDGTKDSASPNSEPRIRLNGNGSVGLQGPALAGKITSDPTLLPAGTYTDTVTVTLDIRP
jgi:hypothetical protein